MIMSPFGKMGGIDLELAASCCCYQGDIDNDRLYPQRRSQAAVDQKKTGGPRSFASSGNRRNIEV